MQAITIDGGLILSNLPILGLLVLAAILISCAFRLYIIPRKRGVGGGKGNGHFQPNGFGGVVGAGVGVDRGEKVGWADGKGNGGGDDGAIGHGASLAGQVDVLPGATDRAGAVAVAAGHPAQGVKRAVERGQVVGHGEHSGACLQVVDNAREKGKPGVHVVSVAAVRAAKVARLSLASVRAELRYVVRVGGHPRSRSVASASFWWAGSYAISRCRGLAVITHAAAVEHFNWAVGQCLFPLDYHELHQAMLSSGACAWSPGGGFPGTVRRGG